MKLALLLLTPLFLIGVIDWNTKNIEQMQYKTTKHIISDVIYTKPSFDISEEDMEDQKAKYEANMEALYKQAKVSPEKWL